MLFPFQGVNPNIHSPRALPWAGCLLAFQAVTSQKLYRTPINRIRDVKIVVWVEYMKNYMYIRTLKKMIIVMTQIVLNIEDKSLLPGLRKILSNLKGVSIVRASSTRKGTLSRAIEDVRKGNVTRVSSVSDLMAKLEE